MKNAANESEVRKMSDRERMERERELSDMKAVLLIPEGRRVLWRMIEQSGVFGRQYETSAVIHYNKGQEDIGHFLRKEILAVDTSYWIQLQAEYFDRERMREKE